MSSADFVSNKFVLLTSSKYNSSPKPYQNKNTCSDSDTTLCDDTFTCLSDFDGENSQMEHLSEQWSISLLSTTFNDSLFFLPIYMHWNVQHHIPLFTSARMDAYLLWKCHIFQRWCISITVIDNIVVFSLIVCPMRHLMNQQWSGSHEGNDKHCFLFIMLPFDDRWRPFCICYPRFWLLFWSNLSLENPRLIVSDYIT